MLVDRESGEIDLRQYAVPHGREGRLLTVSVERERGGERKEEEKRSEF